MRSWYPTWPGAMAGEHSEFTFGDPLIVALRGIEGRHSISNLNWGT